VEDDAIHLVKRDAGAAVANAPTERDVLAEQETLGTIHAEAVEEHHVGLCRDDAEECMGLQQQREVGRATAGSEWSEQQQRSIIYNSDP
jgi:hypothetical protein